MSGSNIALKKDFTIYTNEKGEQFKTTERVIKGKIKTKNKNKNIKSNKTINFIK